MLADLRQDVPSGRAIAIMAPHAGYMYSGAVAGAVYSRVQTPSRIIILGPNHTGMGVPLSIMRDGVWKTPLGDMEIDSDFADGLIQEDPSLEDDSLAHRYEHAVEVQLPFLQYFSSEPIRFTPIVIGTSNRETLERLGRAIATTVKRIGSPTLIVASSDMNHYESDDITRIKDARALEPILKRDPGALYETVRRERISMCGVGPATAMLVAANELGATRSELISYATSADVSGDYDRVVGYAGVIIS